MHTEIAHFGEPALRYRDGVAHCPDLNITAALLSLSGAAWDGRNIPIPQPESADGPKLTEWRTALNQPECRQIQVELVGDHKAIVMLPVIRKGGWTAPDGKLYKVGESAPTERVVYELKAEYRYRTDGAVTRKVPWGKDDWAFWWQAWFTGLLSGARIQNEQRDRLLTLNREKYHVASRLPIAGGSGE